MEIFLQAFLEIANVQTLMLMTIGAAAGLISGAIPGFTIAMGVVLTLPFTFGMNASQGIATMIGVFVGGLSGGLMSGILTGIPGTPSSVATTFDGFPMARRGQPGFALGLGVWASFFGGIISAIMLVALAPQLARLGLEFQPWDYFSLVFFALTITASLSGENMIKGLIAGMLGLFIATIGEDDVNGIARFDFGIDYLRDGFGFLPVLIGLFAFSQLMSDVRDPKDARAKLSQTEEMDIRIEHRRAAIAVLRRWKNLIVSSLIGMFTGILPAAGSAISNILAYDQAKKMSPNPEEFGLGCEDGIIAPESANNATAGGSLITMMALGIPGDVITAVMLGALLIHDVVPSPSFINDSPVLANAIFIAFFFANFLVLFLQSGLLRAFVLITKVRMYMLASVILAFCGIGVFALNNVTSDIWTLFFFGIFGYVFRSLGFPLAPLILGVVLGPVAESWLARALAISSDPVLFVTNPWSLFFLIMAAFSIGFSFYQKQRGHSRWADFYIPALALSLSVPVFMMGGYVRPVLAVGLIAVGLWMLWQAWHRKGQIEPSNDAARPT
ncbi:tripartite tricarboxylate transporter permease [Ruegeria sp.]|uniref:tripartite tricarboxylate transporter permease n=1 Tax=Ruegeria sp. TaxID=1879320 RepID=UPI002316D825|nr:tripartite tricarboxylate transporter permease [Ruegeria sp.]MDA7966028.1 tripartite tricarboxylate transporter permease [Ruegeria sp.]